LGSVFVFLKKLILLFSKDAYNLSKVVKTFIMSVFYSSKNPEKKKFSQ